MGNSPYGLLPQVPPTARGNDCSRRIYQIVLGLSPTRRRREILFLIDSGVFFWYNERNP